MRDIRYDPRLPDYYSEEFYEASLKSPLERANADNFARDVIDKFAANLGLTPAVMDSMRQELLDVARTAMVWQTLELTFQQWARKRFKGKRAYMRIRLEDLGNTEDSEGRVKLLNRLASLIGTTLSEKDMFEITTNVMPAAYKAARFAVCEPLEYSVVTTVAARGFQVLQYSTVADTDTLGAVLFKDAGRG